MSQSRFIGRYSQSFGTSLILVLWILMVQVHGPAARASEPRRKVTVELEVVDAASGKPISEATASIVDAFSKDDPSRARRNIHPTGRTDQEGRVSLSRLFPVEGDRHLFREERRVILSGHWLEFSAQGFEPLAVPLTGRLGKSLDIRSPQPRPIQIALKPGHPTEPLKDMQGAYSRREGMGGSEFLILADGRFAWTGGGCLSTYREYGYARILDGELRLTPIQDGTDPPHPRLLEPFVVVKWGGCPCLVSSIDFQEYCNSFNQGIERPCCNWLAWRPGKKLDDARPAGLPQIPAKWAGCLLARPIAGRVIEVSGDEHAKVSLGRADGVRENMIFRAQGMTGQTGLDVRVIYVGAETCIVETHDFARATSRSLVVGESVTSRAQPDQTIIASPGEAHPAKQPTGTRLAREDISPNSVLFGGVH